MNDGRVFEGRPILDEDDAGREDYGKKGPPWEKSNHINRPPHYTFGKFEVIDVLEDWFPTEPLLWNAVKYLARWNKKGSSQENLHKALWYIQRKLKQLEEK